MVFAPWRKIIPYMQNILNLLKRYGFWQCVKFSLGEFYGFIWNRCILHSFSLNNEDIIFDKLTGYKKSGFYVDVGAYDPYRFSNTMRFYLRGWHGINIEPDTARWSRICKVRKRDINLNIGIAGKKGSLTYYRIDPPTLSTFELPQAKAYEKQGFTILEKTKVFVLPLRDVFQKYAKDIPIDFMSIDVEGMEQEVLESNDWKLYRPHFICIESVDYSKTNEGRDNYSRIGSLLRKVDYVKILDKELNSFYKDNSHE